MIPGSLARRYARALLGLSTSAAQRDRLAGDLAGFADVLRQRDVQGTPVLAVLTAERFPIGERLALVEALARKLDADPLLVKFLQHVVRRGRAVGITQIARAYSTLADEAASRVRARVTSAKPLPADALAGLKSALERATAKQVIVETAVDPALIGGVVAEVGSYVVDGSVASALQEIRSSLGGA